MFVPFDRAVRVNLGVVSLGQPQRLYDCLDALVTHESRHDFTVTCVVNDVGAHEDGARPLPDGVLVDRPRGNLGWPGGLHRARSSSDAELFVWVQEDMTPEPGWLDALVEAADAHPHVGGFGSVRVNELGEVLVQNAGLARPADDVARWNLTDQTTEHLPEDVATYDWVTSKGFLTRTSAFDEVGGPDPRLYPLNHVDKDYCTHLRCHGWDVALVPAARLRHIGSQASPSAFRVFVQEWRDGWFDARWADSVARLEGVTSRRIEHPCADWRELRADAIEVAVGLEASRMLVPSARAQARAAAETLEAERSAATEILAKTAQTADEAVRLFETAKELARAQSMERRKYKHRARRLRKERDEARAALAEATSGPGRRLAGQARRLVRRVRSR